MVDLFMLGAGSFFMAMVNGGMTWYRHYEWIKEKALEQTFKDKDGKWCKDFYLKYCLKYWGNIPLYWLVALITKSSYIMTLSFLGILVVYNCVLDGYYSEYLKKHGYVPKHIRRK